MIYSLVKDPIHAEVPISSSLSQNITLTQMKNLVKENFHAKLIPKGEMDAQLALLDSTATVPNFLNTIREHILHTGGGEIVYGITGLSQLSRITGVRGTILSAFRKFKVNTPRDDFSYFQSQDCIMWGSFCKITIAKFGGLQNALVPWVLTYMRAKTLSQFKTEFQQMLTQIEVKAYEVLGELRRR